MPKGGKDNFAVKSAGKNGKRQDTFNWMTLAELKACPVPKDDEDDSGFSYLGRLVLWHGRNCYLRSATLSQFVIHRGLIIAVIQAVFSALFYFAPIPLYNGVLVVGYATLFTTGPVFSLVLDEDVSESNALKFPQLYRELQVRGRGRGREG